jgi:TolA-binding protein
MSTLSNSSHRSSWTTFLRSVGSLFVLIALFGLSSCALFENSSEEPVKSESKDTTSPSQAASAGLPVKKLTTTTAVDADEFAELQLKHTRLVARIEELEGKFSRQQERLKIIERGLTLGIVPDELKGPVAPGGKPVSSSGKKTERQSAVKTTDSKVNHTDQEADDLADVQNPKNAADQAENAQKPASEKLGGEEISAAVREEFDKAFASAHEDFRAGRYGKAIVEFSEIGKKFDVRLTSGMHKFWIARCWSGLKEMQTARQLFTEFIGSHPQSPWAPRAKLELARVESALGLKETAIKRLRGVISEHPMEDVAEMAKSEVERMSKTL